MHKNIQGGIRTLDLEGRGATHYPVEIVYGGGRVTHCPAEIVHAVSNPAECTFLKRRLVEWELWVYSRSLDKWKTEITLNAGITLEHKISLSQSIDCVFVIDQENSGTNKKHHHSPLLKVSECKTTRC
jgi:hypothetical protein